MKGYCVIFLAILLASCEGIFDFPYDSVEPDPGYGRLYIDASEWQKWYYVNLEDTSVVSMDIPMDATGDTTHVTGHKKSGQYMYWFDIFGEGLSRSEFRYFTPTVAQPEPESWSFAIHRNNVRTNGGSVYETQKTDITDIDSTDYATAAFTPDEWSENEVWDDYGTMFQKLVPSQGIAVNKVLSSWLTIEIKTPPPTYYHNNHVFILKMKDGSFAALQLENYISPKDVTCCMTIRFKKLE